MSPRPPEDHQTDTLDGAAAFERGRAQVAHDMWVDPNYRAWGWKGRSGKATRKRVRTVELSADRLRSVREGLPRE